MTMRAPGPALEFFVLLNERGDAFFEKDSFCLSEEDIRAYKSTVVRDCGQGYVLAPCSRKEAMNAPAGSMTLYTRRYGWCELVPLHQVCNELLTSFLLVPLPKPDDILLLMARLHDEKRLSRAEISHAWELFQKASRQPRSDCLLGMPREDYPEILHCKGVALSPATVRYGPIPPQLRQ